MKKNTFYLGFCLSLLTVGLIEGLWALRASASPTTQLHTAKKKVSFHDEVTLKMLLFNDPAWVHGLSDEETATAECILNDCEETYLEFPLASDTRATLSTLSSKPLGGGVPSDPKEELATARAFWLHYAGREMKFRKLVRIFAADLENLKTNITHLTPLDSQDERVIEKLILAEEKLSKAILSQQNAAALAKAYGALVNNFIKSE